MTTPARTLKKRPSSGPDRNGHDTPLDPGILKLIDALARAQAIEDHDREMEESLSTGQGDRVVKRAGRG